MALNDKVFIVTGGTSGIGRACTTHLAQKGAKVVTASIERDAGEALEGDLRAAGHEVSFVYTDVSHEAGVQGLVEKTLALHHRIDGVVSNAGVWREGKVTDFNEADWDLLMGVNVKGNFYVAKHVVPVFERQGKGVLVITTSVAAFIGFPAHALYCASKAALEALIRCLTTDHAGYLRVVGVCPGTIDTPMLAASCEGWDTPTEELYAEVAKRIPVRRLGKPEDVAKTVAFLLSDDAGFINGTSVFLEGGTMALPPW